MRGGLAIIHVSRDGTTRFIGEIDGRLAEFIPGLKKAKMRLLEKNGQFARTDASTIDFLTSVGYCVYSHPLWFSYRNRLVGVIGTHFSELPNICPSPYEILFRGRLLLGDAGLSLRFLERPFTRLEIDLE